MKIVLQDQTGMDNIVFHLDGFNGETLVQIDILNNGSTQTAGVEISTLTAIVNLLSHVSDIN